ncbi:2-oxo acid dehydrogenase subunit E2 [Bradyrhizobium sp. WSM3983]|uniref:2-oxo acid dehydrogenase subunit E2 n=1 Tax=Bradyrhizobium sp. WSM3983 TaxID=1038867 RepID=UPI0004155607|nr:2-oxo acid dehydrogenase subunit E2 [Bradyrhizobium sp. WSM3983]
MASFQTVELPSIGDYKDVPIVEILVRPGDVVRLDEPLLVLESDKATMEVPSPYAGRIVELKVDIGRNVSQGMPIAVIEVADPASVPSATVAQAEAAVPAPTPAVPVAAPPQPVLACAPEQGNGGAGKAGAHATPSIRAFARELGVDLVDVKASGQKGRVLREDVLAFVKARMTAPAHVGATGFSLPPAPSYDFEKYGQVERIPLSRIQRISGTALHRNWLTIPHVTNFDNADVTELEAFRLATNAEKREPLVKLTMVAFLIKASAIALAAHPRFNASLEGETVIQKKYIHVGFAVDTPNGLLVPVVRDCDRKGLLDIGVEMAALSEKARQGKLQAREMEGGSFSISSLGGIGGTGFTPIINAPEVAILGAARSQMEPRWDGRAFEPRLITPLSLSWDHRVVDGVAAARFLGCIAEILSDLRRAML